MSIIALDLPSEAKKLGDLYDRENLHHLDQDMIQIEMPGRVFIDVGWYADWDENGEYRMMVFFDSVDKPLEPQLKTKDVREIESAIYEMVVKYLRLVHPIPGGTVQIDPIYFNGTIRRAAPA